MLLLLQGAARRRERRRDIPRSAVYNLRGCHRNNFVRKTRYCSAVRGKARRREGDRAQATRVTHLYPVRAGDETPRVEEICTIHRNITAAGGAVFIIRPGTLSGLVAFGSTAMATLSVGIREHASRLGQEQDIGRPL